MAKRDNSAELRLIGPKSLVAEAAISSFLSPDIAERQRPREPTAETVKFDPQAIIVAENPLSPGENPAPSDAPKHWDENQDAHVIMGTGSRVAPGTQPGDQRKPRSSRRACEALLQERHAARQIIPVASENLRPAPTT
jgi:hypothetical protein